MKSSLLTLRILVLFIAALRACAVVPIYINNGQVTDSPQIDATAFLNRGSFTVSGLLSPFTTQNTLYYTNRGTMTSASGSSGGFDFEFINGTTGSRSWASSIINDGSGTITVNPSTTDGPYLVLKATNLVNRGTLSVGSKGLIRMEGSNVDLSSGVVFIQSAASSGTPAYTVSASLAEATNTAGVDPTQLLRTIGGNYRATSPSYTLERLAGGDPINTGPLVISTPIIHIFTNQVDTNRQVFDVVFVEQQSDTNINISVNFQNHTSADRDKTNFHDVYITYSAADTNIVTGSPDIQTFTLLDRLGPVGTASLVTNGGFANPIFQPDTTTFNPQTSGTLTSNHWVTPDLFKVYRDTVNFTNGPLTLTNIVTTNFYTAVRPVLVADGTTATSAGAAATNYSGRVEILASKLNLNKTRVRGQGVVNIRAEKLVDTTGAVLQAPYIYYDLGSSAGSVDVSNLVGLSTIRFASGTLNHMSVIFTNLATTDLISTNTQRNGDTNTPENVTNEVTFEIDFHVVFLKGQLKAQNKTYLAGLQLRGDDATINDSVTPQDRFLVLSKTLTLNGDVTLGAGVGNAWVGTNAPNLLSFTNYGDLTTTKGSVFGTDRSSLYSSWVNLGRLDSVGVTISSTNFENNGVIATTSGSAISIVASEAKLDQGTISDDGDLSLTATSLKLRGAAIDVNGAVGLSISGSLADAGISSPSRISAKQGISLIPKPVSGDLLGTSIQLAASAQSSFPIIWSGVDRGATTAGFTNNAAVSQLYLQAGEGAVFSFSGLGTSNAIYVERLTMDSALIADGAASLVFDDNFTLYFADSNIPVEQLDGALNGHIRWVSSYAGPLSGVKVAVSGGNTIVVNKNLLNSLTLDSNGNGIPNGLDPAPFDVDGLYLTLTNAPKLSGVLVWDAAAGAVYTVDYSQKVAPALWSNLGKATNSLSIPTKLSLSDPSMGTNRTRFYRVTYQP